MTINRIYQGRVRSVEIFDGKDKEGNPVWKKLDDWEEVLWRHHEIFQDAGNSKFYPNTPFQFIQ